MFAFSSFVRLRFSKVIYMCSTLLHMAAESSDLSQAEKKILFLEAKQIAKMIYHFIQNVDFFFIGPGPF